MISLSKKQEEEEKTKQTNKTGNEEQTKQITPPHNKSYSLRENIKTLKTKSSYSKTDCIKGVLHPRPVFWLFMHFSQKLQHIGNK